MLRNVIGAHVQTIQSESSQFFYTKAGCIKICHPAYDPELLQEFHNRNPTSPVAFRMIDDSVNLENMTIKQFEAIKFFKSATLILPPELCWLEVTCNEKFLNGEDLKRLAERTGPTARAIAREGFRPIGFNIAVGNIANLEELSFIYDAVVELNSLRGAIGYHAYTLPDQQLSRWLDLRHEIMAPLLPSDTLWWLNEGLYDHGIQGMPLAGWRYEPWRLDVDSVARYVRRVAQHFSNDSTVIGYTPFGCGPTADWRSFQWDNEVRITEILKELYPVSDTPKLGTGLQRMTQYLGAPLENEIYHFPGTPLETSLAVFENGYASWAKSTNATTGVRSSDGAIFSDLGNLGNGAVIQIHP